MVYLYVDPQYLGGAVAPMTILAVLRRVQAT